jgi:hypothetical protein
MSKRNSFKLVQKIVACVAVLLVLLQGQLFTMASPQDPSPTKESLDGYTLAVKSSEEVNNFLAGSTAGSRFLDGLKSRGVDYERVSYISMSGDPDDPKNDLTVLADKINAGGGSRVSSVDMLIGAYQGSDGKLDGEVLLVANLAGGGQQLLAGFQANDDNLNGNGDPVVYEGDYFKDATAIALLICWIRCFVVQQIIVKLRCVIITIIACIRVGPFLLCAKAQLIICQLTVIIRTIVVCYVFCVVLVLFPVKEKVVTGGRLDSGGIDQKRRSLYSGLPLGQPVRPVFAG